MSELKDKIANDFRANWTGEGKMPGDKLEHAIALLLNEETTAYPCTGEIVSMIFFLEFGVDVTNGKSFRGDAGGASTPGGGALFGNLYTDDIDAVYANTSSFEFNATPVYLSIVFFDDDSNALGNCEFGALSTVTGVGGGTGSWS